MSETITRPATGFRFRKERTRRSRLSTLLLLTAHCSLLTLLAHCSLLTAQAQTVADKMVASVTNGARANPDLITYSDLVWQLALEPSRPLAARASSEDLNQALHLLEDQLLILQEARKLPIADTVQARADFDKEVQKKRDELAQSFGSAALLQERMARVGLSSEQLDAILRDRLTEEKYLDFRFKAFVLISPKEITDRYNQEYARLRNSGRIVPTLEQVRTRIEQELTQEKIASEIDTFIDNLREQPGTEIVIISPV
ncbi:MAG: hypothetical protein QOE96_2238 [Blastocatellia bacterium]|nr:hypothetical protein [Blastocatellia bacterium]